MGIVSALIFLPLLTALLIIFVPKSVTHCIKWIALGGTSLHLLLTTYTILRYFREVPSLPIDPDFTQLKLTESMPWFPSLGISYQVGLDGISLAMVALTSIVIFCGVLASWNVTVRAKEFFALLLILVTGVFGVFLSFDLFLFFVFYELAVLPMYLLIGIWGTGPKEYAAMKLTLMLMFGSAFILVGFLALYHAAPVQTFDLNVLAQTHYAPAFQGWVFPIIFVGFGVLGALFPFHTWSPDGHASAPTAVSMLHAGVLMKLGGYGILRIAIYLLPQGAQMWAGFFMILATINIVYGSFAAVVQKDLKYFTAYSSVSHCGFVLFGLCALNLLGLKGAVIQMFSHGIMTALFFALIGMIYGRTHTRMIPELGGLGKVVPWFAVAFYIGGLASLGLPGLSGFVAESHVFLGGFFGNPWQSIVFSRVLTVLATLSVVVTAVYVLRGLGRVFWGEIHNPHFESLTDATLTERISTGVLVGALFIIGIAPFLMINMIESSLLPFINRLQGGSF